MNSDSKLFRLLIHSPWFLLLFCIIPVLVIISFSAHIYIPLAGYKPLLVNNACFALVVAFRFLYALKRVSAPLRYPPNCGRPRRSEELDSTCEEARLALVGEGYYFDQLGGYAEKRDMGHIGTVLVYGGILLLLATGVLDSLRQFSGTLLDGVGLSTQLNNMERYQVLKKGPLSPSPEQLPLMQIIRQVPPDTANPLGATEIVLTSETGSSLQKMLIPGERFTYQDYDIYMSRLLYEPYITVKISETSKIVFSGPIRLVPLDRLQGTYGFAGRQIVEQMQVDVLYNPLQSDLRVIIHNRGKQILDVSMRFQVDREMVQGGLVLSCEKLGQWSEIHVVRKRHSGLMSLWGIIAVIGLLLRVSIRPRRVWMEQNNGRCRIWRS